MNTTTRPMRSSIRTLPPASYQIGTCALCGASAVLKFCDTVTGWVIGDCCLKASISAERALNFPPAGLRAPSASEAIQMPNH